MIRNSKAVLICGGLAAILGLCAAAVPDALGSVRPGIWEITGLPDGHPVRQCFSDNTTFAQLEHRARRCSQRLLRDSPSSMSMDYNCGPADFGHSDIDVITPRSLRIRTQGITANMPFNYVLQARRIGDCAPAH